MAIRVSAVVREEEVHATDGEGSELLYALLPPGRLLSGRSWGMRGPCLVLCRLSARLSPSPSSPMEIFCQLTMQRSFR